MVSDRLPPASSGRVGPAQTSHAAEDPSHSPAYQTGDSHAAGTPSLYVIPPNRGAPSTSKAGSTAVDLLGQSYEAASRSGQSSSQDRGVIELDQEPAYGGQGRTLSFWFSSTSFPGVEQVKVPMRDLGIRSGQCLNKSCIEFCKLVHHCAKEQHVDMHGVQSEDIDIKSAGRDPCLLTDEWLHMHPLTDGAKFLVCKRGDAEVYALQLDITPSSTLIEAKLPNDYSLMDAVLEIFDNGLEACYHPELEAGKHKAIFLTYGKAPDTDKLALEIFDGGIGMSGMDSSSGGIAAWAALGCSVRKGKSKQDDPPPFLTAQLGRYGVGAMAGTFRIGVTVKVSSRMQGQPLVWDLWYDVSRGADGEPKLLRKTRGSARSMMTARERLLCSQAGWNPETCSFTCTLVTNLKEELNIEALKQYVRVVYHPFLSADYTTAKGQPLAIIFMSSFAEDARGVNLGEMDDDVISKRNMQGKGPFSHEFRVEVCDKQTGKIEASCRGNVNAFYLPCSKGEEMLQHIMGQGQEEGADLPHFNVRFAGRELPNAQFELRSMHKLPHGLLHFMRAHSNIAGLPEVNERACRQVHLTLELDSGIAVKTDKTALKPGNMQDAQSMLTLGIVNLGRSKAMMQEAAWKKSSKLLKIVYLGKDGRFVDEKRFHSLYLEWVQTHNNTFDDECVPQDHGVIVFDFSGVKDNGQVMKSDEARDKMQLMAQPMATFHKELKLESGGVKGVWKTGGKVKLKPLGRGSSARKPTYGTLEYFYISGQRCVIPPHWRGEC
ncbi:TPA: hypothetical protein ACH3X3_007022 [Trebouxia sp. C0006]